MGYTQRGVSSVRLGVFAGSEMKDIMVDSRPTFMTRLTALDPAPPWTLVGVLVAFVAAFVAIIAGTGFALSWLGASPAAPYIGWVLGGVVMAVFVARTRRTDADREALRLHPPRMTFLLLFLSIGIAMLFDLISLVVTGKFLPLPEMLTLAQNRGDVLTVVFATAFMVAAQPIGEELIFRGIAFPVLRGALGAWLGLVVCALMYGVFHLLAYPPASQDSALLWGALALPILDGLYFGLVRAYTGSTRAAVYAHAVFGLFAVLKVFALMG